MNLKPLVLSLALAACAQPEAAPPAPKPAGKPGAPVQLTFAHEGVPQVGVALPVEVIAMPTADVDRLALDIRVDDGLDAVPVEWESGPLAQGAVVKRPLKVTPRGEGEFLVRVEATTWIGEQRDVRVAVHSVTVGKAAKPDSTNGKLQTTPAGERVISMPASEPAKK